MADAVILAGAVAKGAFAGGALSVLLSPHENPAGVHIRRIVGASSGSLNGTYLAAAIRRGTTATTGAELCALWREHAEALGVFDVSARGVVSLEGISTSDKVLALLRANIPPAPGHVPVELRLVTTTAAGEVRAGEHPAATTFEHIARFDGSAFDSHAKLEEVFAAAVASAAFPVVFLPSPMTIEGQSVPCFDGGLCNNVPVKHAIGDPAVSRVFVISSYPRIAQPNTGDRSGLGLVAHLAEILVNERIYRDLREARAVNRALAELETHVTSPALRELILGALGWTGRRPIEIVEIRPTAPLEGNAFAGFFSRQLREDYITAGELAARVALTELHP